MWNRGWNLQTRAWHSEKLKIKVSFCVNNFTVASRDKQVSITIVSTQRKHWLHFYCALALEHTCHGNKGSSIYYVITFGVSVRDVSGLRLSEFVQISEFFQI